MRRTVLIGVVVVLLGVGSAAAQQQTSHTVYGHGVTSCGFWIALRPADMDYWQTMQWMLGYLTATGERLNAEWNSALASDPATATSLKDFCATNPAVSFCQNALVKKTDAAAVRQWMTNYCTAHPLSDLSDAGHALVTELRGWEAK